MNTRIFRVKVAKSNILLISIVLACTIDTFALPDFEKFYEIINLKQNGTVHKDSYNLKKSVQGLLPVVEPPYRFEYGDLKGLVEYTNLQWKDKNHDSIYQWVTDTRTELNYNERNVLIQKETYYLSDTIWKNFAGSIFGYDQRGNLIKNRYINYVNSFTPDTSFITYEYNRLDSLVAFNRDSVEKVTISYGLNNKIDTVKLMLDVPSVNDTAVLTYTYDTNDKLVLEKFHPINLNSLQVKHYYPDSVTEIAIMTIKEGMDIWENDDSVITSYNYFGSINNIIKFTWNSEKLQNGITKEYWKAYEKKLYTYNPQNQLICIETMITNPDGTWKNDTRVLFSYQKESNTLYENRLCVLQKISGFILSPNTLQLNGLPPGETPAEINLLNLTGAKLYRTSVFPTGNSIFLHLNVNLAHGVYPCYIKTANKNYFTKIIYNKN